jgi:hypothetical protein
MAATVWSDYTPPIQRWLLLDGSVASTPELELSGSGRRFRIKGGKESYPHGQLHTTLVEAVRQVAKARGTDLWMPLTDRDKQFRQIENYFGDIDIARIDFQQGHANLIQASWFVKVEEHVYGAVVLSMTKDYYRPRWNLGIEVMGLDTSPTTSDAGWMTTGYHGDWTYPTARYSPDHDADAIIQACDEGMSPKKMIEFIGLNQYRNGSSGLDSPIAAVKAFAEVASKMEEGINEHFLLPILREASPVAGRGKVDMTNYTDRVRADLSELINENASMDNVRKAVDYLVKEMRRAGMVVNHDPSRLLTLTDDVLSVLDAQLLPTNPDGTGELDHGHEVYLNLASGKCHVSCSTANHDERNEAGTAWEVAKFKAELTGETDELLAFAQQYIKDARRTQISESTGMSVQASA